MNDSEISKIQSQIAEFAARRAAVDDVYRKLGTEISEVSAAPPTRAECIEAFDAFLAEQADLMRPVQLEHWFSSWANTDPAYRDKLPGDMFWARVKSGDWQHMILPLLMPVLRQCVTAVIETMSWPENAMTPSQKEQRVATLMPKYEAAKSDSEALAAQAEKLRLR